MKSCNLVVPIKVAIIEDDDWIRENLAAQLRHAGGFLCAGSYRSGEEALAFIEPAHIFGEGTLLGDERARISIVAEDEVRADVVDGVVIRELMAARPDFATRLFRSVASALVERMARLAERAAPPFL